MLVENQLIHELASQQDAEAAAAQALLFSHGGVAERGISPIIDCCVLHVGAGLVDLHWEVFCPVCGLSPEEFGSLEEAHGQIECAGCGTGLYLHLDRDVRVTFSATERVRRERGGEMMPVLLRRRS